jgi:PAS domain S-box-containing protein
MITLPAYHPGSLLHDSGTSLIYRSQHRQSGQPVIMKVLRHPQPQAADVARFQAEYACLQRFAHAGIVQPLALLQHQQHWIMVLEDCGGVALSQLLEQAGQALPPGLVLEMSLQLCDALECVHQAQLVHRDINPANIVWNADTHQLQLIDFGLAQPPSYEPPTGQRYEGTLAYSSPEHTGRTSHTLGYRADYYSLGVTLYQLLSGQLPFDSQDAMELVHSHLARPPDFQLPAFASLPPQLVAVVQRLLEKHPDRRYQTMALLKNDLQLCRQLLADTQPLASQASLGGQRGQLVLPDNLYGRAPQLAQLQQAFARCRGPHNELVLLGGFAGVGKSALAEALRQPANEQGSFFVAGKCEQYKRHTPYAAVIQAFQDLLRQLLTLPQSQLAQWSQLLRDALGEQADILCALLPELALLLPARHVSPPLPPQEAQHRLHRLLLTLASTFASPYHPLVIFLDDLQWADPATLGLIEQLLASPQARHILLLGAYRDNETGAGHPLANLQTALLQQGVAVQTLTVTPLGQEHISQWLADTLQCPVDSISALATLCQHKTRGNPFFLRQFLRSLYDRGLLFYHPAEARWCWQQQALDNTAFTDNVVALMVDKLRSLPANTQALLQLAATLGNRFTLSQLARIATLPQASARLQLKPALAHELIRHSGHDSASEHDDYRFVHDRIQQAAYALYDEAGQLQQHLKVGRSLLAHSTQLQDDLYAILEQLNPAVALLHDPAEREQLAVLNYKAGKLAQGAAAYPAALHHMQLAQQLLPTHAASDDLRHILLGLCDAASHCGQFALADSLYPQLQAHSPCVTTQIEGYLVQMHQYLLQGRFDDALQLQRQCLAMLGISLPATLAEQQAQLHALESELGTAHGLPDSAILHRLGQMSDRTAQAAMALLFGVSHAAYLSGQLTLDALAILHMTRLSLTHGHDELSPYAYALYGFTLGQLHQQYEAAEQWGQLALDLSNKQHQLAIRGNTHFLYASKLGHWQHPLRSLNGYYQEALHWSQESGDLLNEGYILAVRGTDRIMQGQYLPELLELGEQDLQRLQNHARQDMYDCTRVGSVQPLCCLMGLSYQPHSFDDETFSEHDFLQHYQHSPLHLAYYHHSKLFTGYLLRSPDAIALTAQLPHIAANVAGQFKVAEATFYCGLILARALREQPGHPQRDSWQTTLAGCLASYAGWASLCADNFAARHSLLLAEQARLEGQHIAAQQHYQQAIEQATQHGFAHIAAIARENYGDYWLACGQPTIALLFLQQAWQGYQAWGASGKASQLQQLYQAKGLQLASPPAETATAHSTSHSTHSGSDNTGSLDLASILKATRALSGELSLERVLARLLDIVRENTGAQSARLLLHYQNHWLLESGDGQRGKPEPVLLDARQHPQLPLSLLRYVIRTGEALVEGNLAASQRFHADPYVEQHQPGSVLCLPILRKQQVIGVLYLENRLIQHAFSQDRLTFLRMLTLQALVSIDNARLYDNLERQVQERTARLNQIRLEQQAILDNALVGIAFVRDRIFQQCNQGFEQILGYPRGALDKQPTQLAYLSESDYQLTGHLTRSSYLETDMALRRQDGSPVWCAISAKLVNPAEPDAGMVVVIMDISARKAAEQAMAESRQRAEDATRTKSLFLANMSHEIRTPMNAILGMARLALQRDPDLQVGHYLHKILASGEGLLQILNDILDFSKIEAGKLTLESVPFSLDNILERVADVMVLRIQGKPIEPVYQIAANVPGRLIGDPLRLEQILCNLASNAAKFTERGQISLSVCVAEQDAHSVTLSFTMQDSGIGIEPALRDQLFHSFTQADGSVTRRYGGTGLGLAICKQLASLMQGELQVDSQPGRGSSFTLRITLPWQTDTAPDTPLPNRHVLVVDDHPQARSALGNMLFNLGMKVSEAGDGMAALAALHQASEQGQPIDLVLLDSQMPGWSGSDTLQRLRDARLACEPAVVMLIQPYGDNEDELPTGLQGTLAKPPRPASVLTLLQSLAGHALPAPPDEKQRMARQLASLSGVAGCRVLLVDDNAINREVVLGMLEDSGLLIDIAENGVDAVDAVNIGHYDLVLMDIQMPMLDGFAATRQIRANPAHASLPIVALSAHAMVSDHQASLAAGMNDHLDKPIVPDALIATLLRWLPAHQPRRPLQATPRQGSHNLAQRLQYHFVSSYRQLPAKLQLLREAGDWAAIEYHTHSLKAAAAYVDAQRLARLASDIDSALRDHQRLAAEALLPELQDELDKILRQLQDSHSTPERSTIRPQTPQEQMRLLQHLQDKLKHADSRADEALAALFDAMPIDCHEHLINIGKLLDQIEYDQAYRQLQTLIKTLDLPIGSTT